MLVDFDRLLMQFANETLPRVAHSALAKNRAQIAFLADPSQPAAKYCGMELPSSAIVVGAAGSSRHIQSYAACRWATMSLAAIDLSAASAVLTGRELRAASTTHVVHPEPAHMARLVCLHAATRHLIDLAPEIIAHPEVSSMAEHELIRAMVTCLSGDLRTDVSPGWRHHSAIMRRLEDLLAANGDQPLHLTQICAATKATERTLRICCHEHLGMGPIKYLRLRRMFLARRALTRADPASTTVTQIATQYGFGHLGRFAVAYRRLFGQSPSATLNSPDQVRTTGGPLKKMFL